MLLLSLNTFAQSGIRLDSICFEGLDKTKPSFLWHFMEPLDGQEVSDLRLEEEVQKLKNIFGISDASYRIEQRGEKQILIYEVEEQKTLLPIFNFGGIKNNLWFQVGMQDIHWRGRGEQLLFYYQNTDKRPGGQVFYRVPYYRSSCWGYSLGFTRLASLEPLYFPQGQVNYLYDNNASSVSLIRHFGFRRKAEVGMTYFVEKYKKSSEQILAMPPGPSDFKEGKILGKLIYEADYLDYDFIYLRGWYGRLTYQYIYNKGSRDHFNTLQLEARRYFRNQEKANLALRLRLAISTNKDSPFAPFVVDSRVNLRGSGNRVDRGTAQVILNIEHRQSLYTSRYWAVQAVLFSDFGTWRNPGGSLRELVQVDIFRQYLGGGFRLIYQKVYSAILRVDYGMDIFDKESRGLVVGLGQYF